MMSAQRSVSALSLPALETPPLTHERRVASCDDLLSTSRRRGDLEEEEALKAALALSEWELQRSACSTRSPRKEGESKKARLEEPSLGLSVDETPSLADIMGDEVSSLVWER